jgi:hypothetical protein
VEREIIIVRKSIVGTLEELKNSCVKSILNVVDGNTDIPCDGCGKKPENKYHKRIRKIVLDEVNEFSRQCEVLIKDIITNIDEDESVASYEKQKLEDNTRD